MKTVSGNCASGLAFTSCSGLSRDDDGLVAVVIHHTSICVFSDGKNMWFQFALTLANVRLGNLWRVQFAARERIHGNCDGTRN